MCSSKFSSFSHDLTLAIVGSSFQLKGPHDLIRSSRSIEIFAVFPSVSTSGSKAYFLFKLHGPTSRVVQYTRTEWDRLRYAPTRLAGSPMARDLENKGITRVMSLQRVGKGGGSSQSDTDGHDPSLRTPTRLARSPMARDLENNRITRVMSLQRVGKVGGSSRSDTDGHEPSVRIPTRLAGSPLARDLQNKRIT